VEDRTALDAMEAELVSDSLVYRYDPEASPDGLRGSEGTLSLCAFVYVDALARAGRTDLARLVPEKMRPYANHLGLYSEEIDLTGRAFALDAMLQGSRRDGDVDLGAAERVLSTVGGGACGAQLVRCSAGGVQSPVRAGCWGQYKRRLTLKLPAGAGSQLRSRSGPGLWCWT